MKIGVGHSGMMNVIALVALLLAALSIDGAPAQGDANRIRPHAANPFYWEYAGKAVLLMGGWSKHPFNPANNSK